MNKEEAKELLKKPDCIYCNKGNKSEHFICNYCGVGMCNDCYDLDVEHDEHLFDFHESIEDIGFYNFVVEKTGVDFGYICFNCLDKLRKEYKNE